MARFCSNCGNNVKNADSFCPICGTRLSGNGPQAGSNASPETESITCGKCAGFGQICVVQNKKGWMPYKEWVICPVCGGKGKVRV